MTSRPASTRRRLGVAVAATTLATLSLAHGADAAITSSGPDSYAVTSVGAPAAVAAAVAAAPAAPVGKLTASTPGCSVTPASGTDPETVACDLWARAGTTQVLGQPIPIWGYSTTENGAPTAPGPVIVANQGDRVSLTVHNTLAEPTSLALPGQRAADITEGLSDTGEVTGIPTGGSQRFTFTASRAGSFVYEAGHTAGGARQVAMGLAGALVVLGDGTAYGQAYQDEAVLVLSEIDPAFNAHPDTFDMRTFKPAYRLINGKPFPSSDPVPTDQGHTVLLRYVNVGAEAHSMSTLGTQQVVLSHDGHGLGFPEPSVVVPVEAGVTADALVTVPSGPESKIAVYESSARLDNAGQTTADPLSLAFGGMLTFIDTNAPAPTLDQIGPVSTKISATPNPSDAASPVTVTATVSDSTTGHHLVRAAEMVVDDAVTVGPGFGVAMTGSFDAETTTVTGTIPAQATAADCALSAPPLDLHCLTSAKHTVFVRGLDSEGNWGVVGSVILNVAKAGPQTVAASVSPKPANGSVDVTLSATGDDSAAAGTINAAEYFIGAVGPNGSGTAMTLNRSATKVAETGTIAAATVRGLGEGTAQVWVHSRNSQNLWGPAVPVDLPVDLTAPGVNAATVGPNPSNGLIGAKSYPGYLVISAELQDRDAGGGLQSSVVAGEAFIDPTSPSSTSSFGKGLTLVAVDGSLDSQTEQVYGLIPLTQVRAMTSGEHKVYVHGKDAAGNWGSLTATNALVRLFVDKTAPVLGTPTGTPNPTAGATTLTLTAPVTETVSANYVGPRFQAAEFWTGTTDPGVGKATRVQVTENATSVSASVPLTGILPGTYQFNLRVQDAAGNWSNASSVTIQVTRGNAIFSDAFDAGNLLAWTARTGAVGVSTLAGIPSATGNYGMTATGSATPAYVTDESPIAETTYHAQFAFDPNTLSTAANTATWLTVFEGRTATGQAFAVQYQRVATSGSGQLRVVMTRTQGTVTSTGSAISAGAHTVRVDWRQGPATGTTQGQAVLSVDGAVARTVTGANNTTALRIESARLGLTAGNTSSTAGTAWFDSFVSTRISIP